jgi:hypothetical protein
MRPKFAKAMQRLASATLPALAPATVGLVIVVATPKKPIFEPAVLAMFTLSPFIFTLIVPLRLYAPILTVCV